MAANPILWFQKQRVHAPIVRQPVAKLLPTVKQIERMRKTEKEVYSRVSPEDEGDDQGDEECPESCERAVHVTTQRLWTAGAFACTAIACTATCIYSLQSDRLDKNSGLDWELYVGLMLGGALCLLSQAVLAVLLLPKDLSFPVTAFAESAFVYLMPFVSDGFDTLKDIIFSCLCVQSDHLLLKGIGVASWIYLMVIHGILIMQDNTLAELAGCYLPALMALPADPASEDSISSCCPGLSCQHLSDMFCQLLYKQVTPTKRELLLWENVPQGVAAIFFLYFEGGSLFVGVINLAIPVGQVLATFVFFRPLRNLVAPQFGKKLSGFLSKPDFLRAQLLWEEAFEKDRELLRVALPTLLRTPRLEELVREVQTEELADSKEGFEFIQGFIEFVVKNEGVPDSNQRRDMLHEEAQKGTVVAVKVLLAATPVDATDNVGETALHKAAREGKTEVAKLLVDAKAALDAKNRSGQLACMLAALKGQSKAKVASC
ncbi:unnamed protein product [Durusdinium trenchii]|uniref:Uncharacterized protein n=1 Tax=Durusdinium trenchii TaxID=1381693 RepID=A0ABP0IE85_9DINO